VGAGKDGACWERERPCCQCVINQMSGETGFSKKNPVEDAGAQQWQATCYASSRGCEKGFEWLCRYEQRLQRCDFHVH
jgi:hypothetical protein